MLVNRLKIALIATASAGALFVGLANSASAAPLPFKIDPDGISGTGTAPVTVDTIKGGADSLIRQIDATHQQETGWFQGNGFDFAGLPVSDLLTHMDIEGSAGATIANHYNLYILFQGVVSGVSFAAPGPGTVGPGDYNYVLFADVGENDTFAAGTPGGGGGTIPTVGGGIGDDKILALGTSLNGDAGFSTSSAHAPFFSVTASFIMCNATAGFGTFGGAVVPASVTLSNYGTFSCDGFNASTYFVDPVPFYKFDFNSAISSAFSDLNPAFGDTPPNATLNSAQASISFIQTPEPASVALFGMGLLGLGFMFRRRNEKAVTA